MCILPLLPKSWMALLVGSGLGLHSGIWLDKPHSLAAFSFLSYFFTLLTVFSSVSNKLRALKSLSKGLLLGQPNLRLLVKIMLLKRFQCVVFVKKNDYHMVSLEGREGFQLLVWHHDLLIT